MAGRDFEAEFLEIARFNAEDVRDPIELAADDLRVVRAARYLLGGQVDTSDGDCDYAELLAVIGWEYDLNPDEISAAMDICEGRLLRKKD